MELRVKMLQYNSKGQLEELDLGPAQWGTGVPDGRFTYTVEGQTYSSCYVIRAETAQPTLWRVTGYATIFIISAGAAFILAVASAWFN